MPASSTALFKYLKTIGIVNNGDNGRGFANPYDISVSDDGRMFVLNRCDPARRKAIRVGVCNLDEDYLYEFGYGFGDGEGQMVWPVSLTLDRSGRVFVSDEHNHRISAFDDQGNFLYKWGENGTGEGQFDGPAGIAIDSNENLYVSDQKNNRIQKYTLDGDFISEWGESGTGDGQFNLPWGVAADEDDNVYVADWRNDRVQKFDSSGVFIRSYGCDSLGELSLNRPSGVAVDSRGNVIVADRGNERVQVYENNGTFAGTLRGEATLSKWAEDFFASNPDEMGTRQIAQLVPELPDHIATPYHVSSQTEPYFWGPVSVHVDGNDRLYVVETNRHRIQIYDSV